jgi:hypothetical protein
MRPASFIREKDSGDVASKCAILPNLKAIFTLGAIRTGRHIPIVFDKINITCGIGK